MRPSPDTCAPRAGGSLPTLAAGAVLVAGILAVGVPAAAQAPWQAPAQPSAGVRVYPQGASCAAGACTAGDDWGGGGQGGDVYHPLGSRPWVRGEYLLWWSKSAGAPPLASTSLDETPLEDAGVLGLPGTRVLAGGEGLHSGTRLGARLSFGWWLSPCNNWGFETSYMFFGTGTARHPLTSDAYPILARPFFNAEASEEDAVVLAYPGRRTGAFHVDLTNRFDSVSVLFRRPVSRQCDRHWDFLAGYRYARLDEQLAIESSSAFFGSLEPVPVGTLIELSDRFGAVNVFQGAELGIAAGARYCDWSLEVTAKLALGSTRSRVTVDGETVVTVPPQSPEAYSGGMLALPTNMRTEERTDFSMIPELGVNVGWDLTCRLRATLGYSLLFWTQVARPGDQIDRNLDPSQFPPPPNEGEPLLAPAPRFVRSDYWAQGLSFGLDYRF